MSIENAINRLRSLRIKSCDVEIFEVEYIGMLYLDQTAALLDRMKIHDERVCELQWGRSCVLIVSRLTDIPDDMSAMMVEPVCQVGFRHEVDHRTFMGHVSG